MTVQFSSTLRNDRINQIQTRVATAGGTGIVKLFSGSLPTNAAAADPSGALCTINLPTTFLTASGGSTTIAGTWVQSSASGAGLPGNAACFRIYDSAGTCHVQGSVTQTGVTPAGDLVVNNVSITAGQNVSVVAANFVDGNA